ncbi:MAG TPA: hypothetical protein VEA69_11420 [Tepidisphaeraceae bacterium]|nr:hypothetical protein [Tepidisphaeraceae bacterium]
MTDKRAIRTTLVGMIAAIAGGCVGRVAVQVVDAQTGQPMAGVTVYQRFGPGDPLRQVPVDVPVGRTDDAGHFTSVTNDGLINTFEFRQPGYVSAVVQAEYGYRQVGVYFADDRPRNETYTAAPRDDVVVVRLPRAAMADVERAK